MPKCCSKGSDGDLRKRNAPGDKANSQNVSRLDNKKSAGGKKTPQPKNLNEGADTHPDGDGGEFVAPLETAALIEAAPEEGEEVEKMVDPKKSAVRPIMITAVIEKPEPERDESPQRQWQFCLLISLLFAVVIIVILIVVVVAKAPEDQRRAIFTSPQDNHTPVRSGACLNDTPCLNDGACMAPPDDPYNFACTCRTGYTGPNCGTIDICLHGDPCGSHGKCIKNDLHTSYNCICDEGFVGIHCDHVPTPCICPPGEGCGLKFPNQTCDCKEEVDCENLAGLYGQVISSPNEAKNSDDESEDEGESSSASRISSGDSGDSGGSGGSDDSGIDDAGNVDNDNNNNIHGAKKNRLLRKKRFLSQLTKA